MICRRTGLRKHVIEAKEGLWCSGERAAYMCPLCCIQLATQASPGPLCKGTMNRCDYQEEPSWRLATILPQNLVVKNNHPFSASRESVGSQGSGGWWPFSPAWCWLERQSSASPLGWNPTGLTHMAGRGASCWPQAQLRLPRRVLVPLQVTSPHGWG